MENQCGSMPQFSKNDQIKCNSLFSINKSQRGKVTKRKTDEHNSRPKRQQVIRDESIKNLVVHEIISNGQTKAAMSRKYNIPESTIRGWVKAALAAIAAGKLLKEPIISVADSSDDAILDLTVPSPATRMESKLRSTTGTSEVASGSSTPVSRFTSNSSPVADVPHGSMAQPVVKEEPHDDLYEQGIRHAKEAIDCLTKIYLSPYTYTYTLKLSILKMFLNAEKKRQNGD